MIFEVTVEFSGTKKYRVYGESFADVEKMLEKYGSLDHIDNPFDDRLTETITEIRSIPENKE